MRTPWNFVPATVVARHRLDTSMGTARLVRLRRRSTAGGKQPPRSPCSAPAFTSGAFTATTWLKVVGPNAGLQPDRCNQQDTIGIHVEQALDQGDQGGVHHVAGVCRGMHCRLARRETFQAPLADGVHLLGHGAGQLLEAVIHSGSIKRPGTRRQQPLIRFTKRLIKSSQLPVIAAFHTIGYTVHPGRRRARYDND